MGKYGLFCIVIAAVIGGYTANWHVWLPCSFVLGIVGAELDMRSE